MLKAGILIVEDSFIVGLHLQKTLQSQGYYVHDIVSSGEAALTEIEKLQPSVVLMDIMLNGKLDGIETARLIRQKFNRPVIFITALSDNETIQRAKITEPYGYLTKPFDDKQIFTVIEMAMYKHAMEVKLKQSEARFFSTVKSISDAVISIDDQYRIVYANPSAERITGWELAHIYGRSVFEIIQLRDSETSEWPVNPFQCSLTGEKDSAILPNLLLVNKAQIERAIGEGSLSPIFNDVGKAVGLVIIFKDLTERANHKRLIKELERRNLASLLEGQETERSRIARDLHDGLGQTLNAIKMNINMNSGDENRTRILIQLIDEAIQESIRISENLVPAKLKDFDLATCVRSFCESISGVSKTVVQFTDYSDEDVQVDQLQKINIYRIVQEGVNNALKHAGANVINVQLNIDSKHVQLMIEDDGKGFQKNSMQDPSKHHGLVNMKDRAEIMNGTFTIESDNARGTLIILDAPLKSTHNTTYAKA